MRKCGGRQALTATAATMKMTSDPVASCNEVLLLGDYGVLCALCRAVVLLAALVIPMALRLTSYLLFSSMTAGGNSFTPCVLLVPARSLVLATKTRETLIFRNCGTGAGTDGAFPRSVSRSSDWGTASRSMNCR
jgi:hypothetical protein